MLVTPPSLEVQYLSFVHELVDKAERSSANRPDRTGVGTYSVFGRQLRCSLSDGYPLLTTKKVHLRSIIGELLWFISGETNIRPLQQDKISIWDEWANSDGELGPVYGKQWRSWEGPQGKVDQLAQVLRGLKENPWSRRHLVIAYNPSDLPAVAPPACHTLFQFYVEDNRLSLQLYQRSADIMLGVPFNIASYALLLLMVAQVVDLIPYEFIHTFGDLHLYTNHLKGAKEQLSRSPRTLPHMQLNRDIKDLFSFTKGDFSLVDYDPYPSISFPIAV
jgi:thymidylate synthase